MRFIRLILVGALLMAGVSVVAEAQQPSGFYPGYQVPPPPPSWNYDPYTSGLGPCPQRTPGDPPCRYTMHPTYGQPSYWPTPR